MVVGGDLLLGNWRDSSPNGKRRIVGTSRGFSIRRWYRVVKCPTLGRMQTRIKKRQTTGIQMSGSQLSKERIYSLDVLRGIAALSVVLWHWQHFFAGPLQPENYKVWDQPLFSYLRFFYLHGNVAVELFFCISGFVFFWLFSQKILDKELTVRPFIVDRFSRLYPLHILTFAIVAILQATYSSSHNYYFVYQTNDFYHAMLNILLMPAWGLEHDWSFNAPIWSVSVEVLLYAAFFTVFKLPKFRMIAITAFLALGAVTYPHNDKLGSGLFSFFCGGVAYILLNEITQLIGSKTSSIACTSIAIAAWIATYSQTQTNMYLIMGITFPATVMAIASISSNFKNLLKRFAWIGDLSYSSYLIHFPLQIAFATVVDRLGYDRSVFYSPWSLLIFMACLIPLSLASHAFFEMPAQRALRSFLPNRGLKPAPGN